MKGEWLICYPLSSVLVLVMSTALNVSVVGLERALLQYCSQPQEEAFDMKTVPIDTAPFNKNRMECKLFLLPHPFFCHTPSCAVMYSCLSHS